MRFLLLAAAFPFTVGSAPAQGDAELLARDRRIKEHLAQGAHASAIAEINVQIAAVAGTTWEDSLWTYISPLGSAEWKEHGPEAAAAATEGLYQRIAAAGRAPMWEIKALIKLSALYYDLSLLQESERVSKMALAAAERNSANIPPIVLADAHYCMADAHMDLGQFDLALPLLQRAISIAESIEPLPASRTATYFSGLGGAQRRSGRTREAEDSYKQGLALIERDTSLEGLTTRATLLGNWAIVVQSTGDLHRSKEVNTRSLQAMDAVIARKKNDPQGQMRAKMNRTRILLNLASTYFDLADYDRSRSFLETARAERKAMFGEEHPSVIGLNDALAELEAMAGDYERAEALLEEQLNVFKTMNEGGGDRLMELQSKLARMVAKQGDLARADSIYVEALPKDERTLRGSASRSLANALAERADLRIAQGRYADAIHDLLLSRGIRVRMLGPLHERIAEADVVISSAALAMGDTLMARQFSDSAWMRVSDRIAQLNGPYAPTALRYPALLADAVITKVAVERAMRPEGGKERTWMQYLDLAFASLHRNMNSLSGEGARLHMAGSQRQLFDLGLELAHAAHERFGETEDLDRFLRISESDRSILLKNHLNTFTSLRYANVPDSVLAREQQLLKTLSIDPDDGKAWDDLYKNEQAYAAFLDTLREHHPQYFALRHGEPRITIADLREQLVTPQRDLLAYASTKEHLYMLVVRSDTAALVRVSSRGLSEAVELLSTSIGSRNTGVYVGAAHALYKMAFAPVEALLTQQELLIIPDGALHKVNFEALLTKPDGGDFRRNLLIQRYAIAYLLSATTAVQFSALAQRRATGALAMAPGFDDELKRRYTSSVADTSQLDRGFLRYVRQPFALSTAQGLGDLLSARVMVGDEASEQHFRELARDYGILHLGTHAEMNESAPMYSRFVLSKDSAGLNAQADGYLHAYEIYELDLRAQLAVLTACETGTGRNDDGEGVRSLGYSFAYAGCPSLVMSLWSIDEKVSSEIIARFYEHLADGMPKHEALRQAKLDHLNNATDELALPYYWAGMVLVGDVAPVEVGSTSIRQLWWIVGVVVLVLAMMLILRRRKVWNATFHK